MPAPIQNCDVEFAYDCPRDWSSLIPTDREGVRFCQKCSKDVFFCKSSDEASNHASLGHCIALQLEETSEPKRASIHDKLNRVRRPRVGMMVYEVEGANAFDEGARKAMQNLGRVIEEELKEFRKSYEANAQTDSMDNDNKSTKQV